MRKLCFLIAAGTLMVANARAATFTVTSIADPGDGNCTAAGIGDGCTLREAILAANTAAGQDTISFAPGVTGTIQLTSALPNVTTDMSILGPGARKLTVRRDTGGDYRLFTVSNGTQNGPRLVLSGLTLTNGKATGSGAPGGAISNDHGEVDLFECTISGNSASNGAGINNNGSVNGSAILIVTNSTFSGNSASQFGGAIFNSGTNGGSGGVDLLNCTIADNSAGSRGAAIHQTGDSGFASTTLEHCTISNNSASLGGIFNTGFANLTTRSCIFKTGATGANFANTNGGTLTSQGFNLSNDGAGDDPSTPANESFLKQTDDSINTNPMLDSAGLANNGGPTDTVALLSTSPAIDHGDQVAALGFDQRSYERKGRSDIGSYEFGATIPVTLANISTRLRVETGDNALIGGFIITGTHAKRVVVRAIGTSLPLADKLGNPTLELHGPNGLIESNDNWVDSPNKQAIVDSGLFPNSSLESAIIATLPGNGTGYTAIVRGVNGGTGIGVVEAYDLDRTTDSKLANISTRGLVQTGDNVLFAGMIVLGSFQQTVLVRAIGPSLAIAGKLANPTLQLFDSNGTVLEENDNWVDSPNKQGIINTGIPPSNNLESAILRLLSPANYTAIVRGANNATGIAVVEVYALN